MDHLATERPAVDPSVVGMDMGADTTLMIVDDDKPFCQRLARAMETRGFVVTAVSSVEEGLAAIAEKPPAYAVIDMRLADGNGRQRPDQRPAGNTGVRRLPQRRGQRADDPRPRR